MERFDNKHLVEEKPFSFDPVWVERGIFDDENGHTVVSTRHFGESAHPTESNFRNFKNFSDYMTYTDNYFN